MSRRIGRIEVLQHSSALRGWQYRETTFGATNKSQQEIVRLQHELAEAIFRFGGIEQIDKWIERHHPDHSQLKDIKDIDWSWRDQHPVTINLRKRAQKRRRRMKWLVATVIVIVVVVVAVYLR